MTRLQQIQDQVDQHPSLVSRADILWLLSRVGELETEIAALREAAGLILSEPHGCPMCDSGTLRSPDKEHWDTCGFAKVHALMEAVRHV